MTFLPRIRVRDKLQQESRETKDWIPHQVRNDRKSLYFHISSPLSKALVPAKSKRPITIHLIAFGFVLASIRTPTIEPSIIPTTDGTTIIGSTPPEFKYIHAADVSVMESK